MLSHFQRIFFFTYTFQPISPPHVNAAACPPHKARKLSHIFNTSIFYTFLFICILLTPQHDHYTCWADARTSSTHFVLHQIPIISRWVCRTNSATSPSIGESKNVLVCLKPVLFPLSYFDFLLIFSELFLWIAGNVYQLQIAVMFYLIERLDPPWEKCWYWDLE